MDGEGFARVSWEHRRWAPVYELIRKKTGLRTFHEGEDFSREEYSVARVVDHDHCLRCWATFSPAPAHLHEGWHNPDEGWLCEACHEALSREAGEG